MVLEVGWQVWYLFPFRNVSSDRKEKNIPNNWRQKTIVEYKGSDIFRWWWWWWWWWWYSLKYFMYMNVFFFNFWKHERIEAPEHFSTCDIRFLIYGKHNDGDNDYEKIFDWAHAASTRLFFLVGSTDQVFSLCSSTYIPLNCLNSFIWITNFNLKQKPYIMFHRIYVWRNSAFLKVDTKATMFLSVSCRTALFSFERRLQFMVGHVRMVHCEMNFSYALLQNSKE